MARVATTDLFLQFIMGAGSFPSTTVGGNIITALYKEAYTVMYGPGKYSPDDSTDSDDMIDISDTFVILQSEASDICDAYHFSGIDSPRPTIELSKTAIKKLNNIKIQNQGFVDNIRWMGSDYNDWDGVFY